MRFFLFCVSHHLIDDITLIHVTHCVMNLFFLLTQLFLKDSLTISLSYLLELNLFAHNVVLCLPDTTLRCDCRRLISRNYWFEQVMLLLQVKFINTLKFVKISNCQRSENNSNRHFVIHAFTKTYLVQIKKENIFTSVKP